MSDNRKNLPLILIILDGWGLDKPNKGNAVSLAKTPNIDDLLKKYPSTKLFAHGKYVGLPDGQDGNSEAGHMNIGAGRLVEQDSVKIHRSIKDETFFSNPAFIEAVRHVKRYNSNLHLMGMLSNGMSAHSDPSHITALLEMAHRKNIKNVYLHLFTDGRDSPKYAAQSLVKEIRGRFTNGEKIATIMGRFYAMDRKKKWERTKKAYEALVLGKGIGVKDASRAITESYNKGDTDEFIEPYVIKNTPRIKDNDSVIFFNLRSDRARQLAKTFSQEKFNKMNPNSFIRQKVLKNIRFVAMTDFGPDLDLILSAFPTADIKDALPIALKHLTQLYTTETEKYAHVSYFFNGGYAGKVNGEEYHIVKSPNVRSYDETPVMEAVKLTDNVLDNLKNNKYDFTFLNFPAPDMIGHTGNLKAGIECCEKIDKEVGRIVKKYLKANGTILLTADHGNVEEMINLKTGEIDTEHSSNKVFFIVVNKALKNKIKLKNNGALKDIAPTLLHLLSVEKPEKMTGENLIYARRK